MIYGTFGTQTKEEFAHMAKKKYLKGFANLGIIPVTENTASSYKAAGERVLLPGARSCSPTDNRESFSIPGDDGIYDSGAQWQSTDLTITVNEMSLDTLALLGGVDMEEEAVDELEEGVFDNPPEHAITFSALRGDGGYRLYRYYVAKCTGYTVSHTTKGDSTDAQTYELTFSCRPRETDGKIRGTKDVDAGTALTWLETIPTLPASPGP